MQKDDTSLPLSLQSVVLRRNNRIQGHLRVEEIIKKGEEDKSRFFVLRRLKTDLGHNRYGIVLSKKLAKSAVKRNRLRRQIYEIIRLLEKEGAVPSSQSFDIVLLARKATLKLSYDKLAKVIREIITSA